MFLFEVAELIITLSLSFYHVQEKNAPSSPPGDVAAATTRHGGRVIFNFKP